MNVTWKKALCFTAINAFFDYMARYLLIIDLTTMNNDLASTKCNLAPKTKIQYIECLK